MMTRTIPCALALALVVAACGDGDELDSDTEARRAYLGFDRAIDRAINLGFDGFNAANSANIPVQSDIGDVDGTMDVGGQVDQGASDNKEMRLALTLVDYTDQEFDDPETEDTESVLLSYDTDPDALPSLDMSLRNIPNGTFIGTLAGTFIITGDVDASADFVLSLSGEIQDSGGDVIRVPGTLVITGTATSGDGVFDVNVMK